MYVSDYYSNLNDSDHVYKEDYTEKAKDVVVATLVPPQTSEYEEQFNNDHHERYQSCEQSTVDAFHVPRLRWNLAWDDVRLRRMLPYCCLVVTVPTASVN